MSILCDFILLTFNHLFSVVNLAARWIILDAKIYTIWLFVCLHDLYFQEDSVSKDTNKIWNFNKTKHSKKCWNFHFLLCSSFSYSLSLSSSSLCAALLSVSFILCSVFCVACKQLSFVIVVINQTKSTQDSRCHMILLRWQLLLACSFCWWLEQSAKIYNAICAIKPE